MKNRKLSFRSNSAYGFSVVELIVALTIMTIIVTVGFSAYTYFQTDYGKVARKLEDISEKDVSIKSEIYNDLLSSDKSQITNNCLKLDLNNSKISDFRDCLKI